MRRVATDFGISGQYVTRLLDQAAIFRGYPSAVRTDNGPEFTSRAFMAWTQARGIRHLLIQPGRPMRPHGFACSGCAASPPVGDICDAPACIFPLCSLGRNRFSLRVVFAGSTASDVQPSGRTKEDTSGDAITAKSVGGPRTI